METRSVSLFPLIIQLTSFFSLKHLPIIDIFLSKSDGGGFEEVSLFLFWCRDRIIENYVKEKKNEGEDLFEIPRKRRHEIKIEKNWRI